MTVSDTRTLATRDGIRALVAEALDVTEDEIEQSESFREDLGADSLILIELQGRLERHFDIEIPNEQADLMVDLASTCEIVWSILPGAVA